MEASVKPEPIMDDDTISLPDEEKPFTATTYVMNMDTNLSVEQPNNSKEGKRKIKKYNPNNKKLSGKTKRLKKSEFTLYLKKSFFQTFLQEGCTPQIVEECANAYNISVDTVNEYFGTAAKEAQKYVQQECDSLSFSNITDWLKYFQAAGVTDQSNYESAIIINAIANNDYHPNPETMGGINLKMIYKFLSDSLMGLPQKPLDPASAKFLSNEFQNLINEANTDEADFDVSNMKAKIETALSSTTTTNRMLSSLDPLNIANDELLQNFSDVVDLKCKNNEINLME